MKVKSIKKTLAVMLSMAMMLSLAGCGDSSESQPVADEPAATAEPAADEAESLDEAAAEDTEAATGDTAGTGLSGSFSIFHFHEDEGAGTSKAFWTAANKFMEENPDVNIEFIFTDSDNYQEKLTTLMAGDELPDRKSVV